MKGYDRLCYCGDQEDPNWDQRAADALAAAFRGSVVVGETNVSSAKPTAKNITLAQSDQPNTQMG